MANGRALTVLYGAMIDDIVWSLSQAAKTLAFYAGSRSSIFLEATKQYHIISIETKEFSRGFFYI